MPNFLSNETSPYLLQHANNPVEWYPWGEQALSLARNTGKPILLSIGYTACHWCHVMEKESFQDKSIAEVMNQNFICIKVDREERPDLDKIYQSAHQILTERPGGWPLTVALTPDGHAPFFAGTYFPPEPRFDLPGFADLLDQIATHFQQNRSEMSQYHQSFSRALGQLNPQGGSAHFPDAHDMLLDAVSHLENTFDGEFGGFGQAPKFPHPTQLELLLAHHLQDFENNDIPSLEMAEKTLTNMSRGGLNDQLGGGFFRYCTDANWTIPHFEKMLYDNAQLLQVYCDLYCITQKQEHRATASTTAEWVIREMQTEGGGYASALDADSEGIEGKFYLWSETDLRAMLTQEEYQAIENYFALYGDANFDGYWHFNVNSDLDAHLLSQTPELNSLIESAKDKLFCHRQGRQKPKIDDKILTGWNGLMIKAMARAGRVLQNPGFTESAASAAHFLRRNTWQPPKLLAVCRDGRAHLNGYLDDYAFLLEGILELLKTRWSNLEFEFAVQLGDAILDHFEDPDLGGFYFTSHDHESLLYRPKPGADDAIPSGNGAAINALLKLGHLSGHLRFIKSAERGLKAFAESMIKMPSVYGSITLSLQNTHPLHKTIVLFGDQNTLNHWQSQLALSARDGSTNFYQTDLYPIDLKTEGLPKPLAHKRRGDQPLAYVCHGTHCLDPIEQVEDLIEAIRKT